MPEIHSFPRLRPLLLALALLALPAAHDPAAAQEAPRLAVGDSLVEVTLRGGESFVGRVVRVAADTISLETVSGTRMEIARSRIDAVRPARGRVVRGQFWREDPNRTRLFFSPTGRSMPAGGGYVGVYEVFIPFVTMAVTDRIMLSGGSPFYLAFTGDVTPPVYFGPKVQVVSTPRFQGSLGSMTVYVPDDGGDDGFYSVLYGVGTVGGADRALTAGAGWGYVDGEFSPKPVVMVGGETRVSRSIKLVSENMFVPGEDGLVISGGVRFFGERLSADAGLAGFAGGDGGCCFPLVNFVYHFGRQ